jgi:hypothetical protein
MQHGRFYICKIQDQLKKVSGGKAGAVLGDAFLGIVQQVGQCP